jgi:hypothetical protein
VPLILSTTSRNHCASCAAWTSLRPDLCAAERFVVKVLNMYFHLLILPPFHWLCSTCHPYWWHSCQQQLVVDFSETDPSILEVLS